MVQYKYFLEIQTDYFSNALGISLYDLMNKLSLEV